MPKYFAVLFLATAIILTGCSTYHIGKDDMSDPNGSYAGTTMNSSVTDENPHAGGDASYANGGQDKDPVPPEKVNGR